MKRYNLINNLVGWAVFVISVLVYSLTLEPSVSLWDCGEFISAAYRMQVVHPPGAPLFLLIGRFFALFAGGNVEHVAIAVNMLSAITSAFTATFTFWIITHMGRKVLGIKRDEEVSGVNLFSLVGAGMVGALAVTFMDSFWFSAVEAEVYASSSFFTALTFWAIFKWENVFDQPGADRWVLFIAYMVGLSIGVHLLNLLVIPAVSYFYYFKKNPYSPKGLIISTVVGFGMLLFIQYGIIPGIPKIAANADRFFVNEMHLGFGSGAILSLLLLVILVAFGVYYFHKTNKPLWNTVMLGICFVLIGYSSYTVVVIRSMAEVPIDMNNPEDPYNLVSYINREQYGDRPLIKGPWFGARAKDYEDGAMQWRKGETQYEEVGARPEPVFDGKDEMLLPRMGDQQKSSSPDGYALWSGCSKTRKPTMAENMKFLFKYQLGYMYWRYFMWNFAGRQNDEQGMSAELTRGNWISGVPVIDNMRLGPQGSRPDSLRHNRGHNTYFFLPMILGIIGIVYQFRKDRRDFWVSMTLFVFTGIFMIMYLNQPPFEPRERDYASVGSFQTYCIWIGLGVLAVIDYLSKRMNRRTAASVATVACLAGVPVLMASQNWDDHDRSNRYLAIDFAKDYLNSCDSNAILFTNGDNDTYPLWYAQNVEGYRTDVRIINLSLLSTDWYANALRRQVYASAPLAMSLTPDKIVNGVRDYLRFIEDPQKRIDPNSHYNLKDIVAFVGNDTDPSAKLTLQNGEHINYLPTTKFFLPVDREKVIANGTVPLSDAPFIQDKVYFDLQSQIIYKGTLVVLDILASNNWERPIYFTTTTGSDVYMHLQDYFRLEGLTYRLTPVKNPNSLTGTGGVNKEILYKRLMTQFRWGGMEHGKIWVDDKATLVPNQIRGAFAQLGRMYADMPSQGAKDTAIKVMDYCFASVPESVLPMYNGYKLFFAESYYVAGDRKKGNQYLAEMVEKCFNEFKYYNSFPNAKKKGVASEIQENRETVQRAYEAAMRQNDTDLAKNIEGRMKEMQ